MTSLPVPVVVPHAELMNLERALAERDPAAVPGGLASLIDDDFLEFGSSGRRWDRDAVVADLVPTSARRQLEFTDWAAIPLAEEIVLVTYTLTATLEGGPRTTRRSSIWRMRDGRWRILFHQGTPIAEPAR